MFKDVIHIFTIIYITNLLNFYLFIYFSENGIFSKTTATSVKYIAIYHIFILAFLPPFSLFFFKTILFCKVLSINTIYAIVFITLNTYLLYFYYINVGFFLKKIKITGCSANKSLVDKNIIWTYVYCNYVLVFFNVTYILTGYITLL